MIVYDKHNNIQPDIKYIYREINGLKLPVDIYNPKIRNNKNDYAIICIHGGGWHTGITKDSDWNGGDMVHQAKIFSQLGYIGVAISYRSIDNPETDIKDLIDDCKYAIKFIKEKLNLDNDRIILIGDSAGAHLATMLGISDDDDIRPRFVIACNPVLDCTGTFAYSSDSEETRINVSPVFADVKKCSRFLFINGDADPTTPIKNTIIMNNKLKEMGFDSELITLEGVLHAFILYDYRSLDDEVIKYMEMIVEYLDKDIRFQTYTSKNETID